MYKAERDRLCMAVLLHVVSVGGVYLPLTLNIPRFVDISNINMYFLHIYTVFGDSACLSTVKRLGIYHHSLVDTSIKAWLNVPQRGRVWRKLFC